MCGAEWAADHRGSELAVGPITFTNRTLYVHNELPHQSHNWQGLLPEAVLDFGTRLYGKLVADQYDGQPGWVSILLWLPISPTHLYRFLWR